MYKLGIVAGVLVILLVTTSGCSFLATTPRPATKPGISDENSPGETPTIPQQYVASSLGSPKSGPGGIPTPKPPEAVPMLSGAQSETINGTGLSGNSTNSTTTNSSVLIPFAQFTSDVRTGYAPLKVNFRDTSLNMPTAWCWTFGDRTSSILQNPFYTYYYGGQYTIGFTASNDGGSNFLNSTNYISVYQPDFYAYPLYGSSRPAGLTVTFINSGYGSPPPTKWNWSFGDGTYSTITNTTHQYLIPGTYDVNLSISGQAGTTWVNRSAYVTVT
jgi:PKD repeat protein